MVKISERDMIRVLCIIYLLCGGSPKCHIPLEAIESKVPGHERGKIKKVVKELVTRGLVYEKPHGKGRKSYGLTREGIRTALNYCKGE